MSEEPGTLERAVEATLFAAEAPMSVEALAGHLGGLALGDVREALGLLEARYRARGVHLVERGGRWHFETADPAWRSLHHVAGGHFYAIGEALTAAAER